MELDAFLHPLIKIEFLSTGFTEKKKKSTCVNHIPQHKSSCHKRIGFTFQNYLNTPQLQTPVKLNILCEEIALPDQYSYDRPEAKDSPTL